jgi:SIT family siderophore-iron:H+ symporter-like MFS transporter
MNTDYKRAEAGDASSGDESVAPNHIKLTGKTSPGVKRMEAISKHITFQDRILLFITIFVLAYAYTLDNTLRYTLQVCILVLKRCESPR